MKITTGCIHRDRLMFSVTTGDQNLINEALVNFQQYGKVLIRPPDPGEIPLSQEEIQIALNQGTPA